MVSKRDLDFRLRRQERITENRGKDLSTLYVDIQRLERLVEDLAEQVGYRVTYKKGLYLEPIEEDVDE